MHLALLRIGAAGCKLCLGLAQSLGLQVTSEHEDAQMRMSQRCVEEFVRRLAFSEFRLKIEKEVRRSGRVLRERGTVANALPTKSRVLRSAEDLAAKEEIAREENHRGSSVVAEGASCSAMGLSSCSTSV